MLTTSRRWGCAVCAVTASLVLSADAAFAQHEQTRAGHVQPSGIFSTLFEAQPLVGPGSADGRRTALAVHPIALPMVPPLPPATRRAAGGESRWLPALYVGFGVLQALDAHSTLRAVEGGHRERNPVVAPLAHRPGAMVGLKAATTAGTIYLAHRLGRRNRVAAIVLMVAMNSAYGAIVAANYGREPVRTRTKVP